MPTVVPAFAIALGESQMPNCETLNRELQALFLAREAEGATYRNPNPTMRVNPALFESHFDLFAWPDEPVQKLRSYCWNELSHWIAQLNGYSAEELARIQIHADVWFHITRRNGWFGLHNHPMASWSGVYCVSAGRDDGSHPESGKLHFANPLSLANMYVDVANARIRAPYAMSGKSFQLRPGQLIIFPSYLQHEVFPFFGDGERITVAFNAWFSMPGTATPGR